MLHHTKTTIDPERAIRSFEEIHTLKVTVHDLSGCLGSRLHPIRFSHRHDACQAIKVSSAGSRCLAFELTNLRSSIHKWPNGRIHACHAGLVEWVVPLWIGASLHAILFAGVRRDIRRDEAVHRQVRRQQSLQILNNVIGQSENILPFDPTTSAAILEHLQALAARLTLWLMAEYDASSAGSSYSSTRTPNYRRTHILQYLMAHFPEPISLSDMAIYLELSESHTSHLIKELFDDSFSSLLSQVRFEMACQYLRSSSRAISNIAMLCGYESVSGFHRAFKKYAGTTPHQYRSGC